MSNECVDVLCVYIYTWIRVTRFLVYICIHGSWCTHEYSWYDRIMHTLQNMHPVYCVVDVYIYTWRNRVTRMSHACVPYSMLHIRISHGTRTHKPCRIQTHLCESSLVLNQDFKQNCKEGFTKKNVKGDIESDFEIRVVSQVLWVMWPSHVTWRMAHDWVIWIDSDSEVDLGM